MGTFATVLRRAAAQRGALLTLLVLLAAVAGVLAGTVGYTRAATVATVHDTLAHAPAGEGGLLIQTRLSDQPTDQDEALRATVGELLADAEPEVSRSLRSTPVEPTEAPGSTTPGELELTTVPEPEVVTTTTAGAGEVLVLEAHEPELPVGSVVEMSGIRLTVAGTWRPADAADRHGLAAPADDADALLLAAEDVLVSVDDTPFVRWSVLPTPATVATSDLPDLAAGISALDYALSDDDAVALRGLTIEGGLGGLVEELRVGTETASAVGLVPVALLAVVALVAEVQVLRLLGQTRARETEILIARGAAPHQLASWAAVEIGGVALLGSGGGTALAALVVARLDGGSEQLRLMTAIGAAPALVALVTGIAVAWLQARRTARTADSSGRLRGATAAGAVVLTGAAAVLATWQLRRYGTPLIEDGSGVDLLAVLALGALLAALAMVALAVLGPLTRAVAALAARARALPGVLAARQTSRWLRAYAVPVVLLVLAAASATTAAAFAGTTALQRDQVAALATGADVRLGLPEGAGRSASTPAAQPYAELDGVTGAGTVLRRGATLGETDLVLTALATDRLAEVARVPGELGLAEAAAGLRTPTGEPTEEAAAAPTGTALPAGTERIEITVRAALELTAQARAAYDEQVASQRARLEQRGADVEEPLARQAEEALTVPLTFALWLADPDGALNRLELGTLEARGDEPRAAVGPEASEHRLAAELPAAGEDRIVGLDVELPGAGPEAELELDVVALAADGAQLTLPSRPWQLAELDTGAPPEVQTTGTIGLAARIGSVDHLSETSPSGTTGTRDLTLLRLVPTAAGPVPALASSSLAATADLAAGDELSLRLGGRAVTVRVHDVIEAIPGGLEDDALLVDQPALNREMLASDVDVLAPDEVWLTVEPGSEPAVATAATELAGPGSEAEIAGQRATDSAASVRTTFWIAAAGAGALALVGVAAVALALAGERRSEVMVLRALGLPPRRQVRTRTLELLGTGALGIAFGVLAGWLAAAVLVPTLARAAATQHSPMPLPLAVEPAPLLALLGLLTAGLAVVVGLVGARVRAQALDAEYREEVR